jgi:1,2-beta-oligoglucan phosphorylase
VEIDPVLPAHLDGLRATVPLAGGHLRLRYRVDGQGEGVEELRLGERVLEGRRTANPYRRGALVVDLADLADALRPDGPELEVHLP